MASALLLPLGTAAGAWLVGHLRPKHAHFRERIGPIAAVDERDEGVTPAGFRHHRLHVRAETGLAVNFSVLHPAGSGERVPLMVLLAGHRTGRHAIELVGDPGQIAVAALDAAAGEPRSLLWTDDGHLQTNRPDIVRQLLTIVREQL